MLVLAGEVRAQVAAVGPIALVMAEVISARGGQQRCHPRHAVTGSQECMKSTGFRRLMMIRGTTGLVNSRISCAA